MSLDDLQRTTPWGMAARVRAVSGPRPLACAAAVIRWDAEVSKRPAKTARPLQPAGQEEGRNDPTTRWGGNDVGFLSSELFLH
jgi:hypothetical protein